MQDMGLENSSIIFRLVYCTNSNSFGTECKQLINTKLYFYMFFLLITKSLLVILCKK